MNIMFSRVIKCVVKILLLFNNKRQWFLWPKLDRDCRMHLVSNFPCIRSCRKYGQRLDGGCLAIATGIAFCSD